MKTALFLASALLVLTFSSDVRSADPDFPVGNYTFQKTWKYNKTYSDRVRAQIRRESDGRVLITTRDRKEKWVFYPSGRWVMSSFHREFPVSWKGRWKRQGNTVSLQGASGRESASLTFTRINSREWKMAGIHKVRGKTIGLGSGTLRRAP
jgi:hypothetical protein